MKCKYPEKDCMDRYRSHAERKEGLHCRLKEWKKKKGICPYNKEIRSRSSELIQKKHPIKLDKYQKRLI